MTRALIRRGWVIVGRNRRLAGVEVDIIARREDHVVLWEVKRRTDKGYPSLSDRQLARLARAAEAYASRRSPTTVGIGLAVVGGWRAWPRVSLDTELGDYDARPPASPSSSKSDNSV